MSEDEPRSHANAEVARLFAELADILELQGEPVYRYSAYRTAARSIASATESLDDLFKAGHLRQLRGVGQGLEARIVEYLTTGRMESYEQARRDFPVALASLMQVPGLGPTKARAVYHELGISSAAELEQAARDGRLRDVPGFGEKVAESVLANLERMKQRAGRGLLSDGWVAVHQVQEALGSPAGAERIAVVGSVRRMQDTIGGVDLLAARDDLEEAERLIDGVSRLPNLVDVRERASDSISVRLYGGLDVRLFVVPRVAWGSALVWYTGSAAHVAHLTQLASEQGWTLSAFGLEDELTGARLAGESEVEVYERLGLAWVPPELREDEGEIEAALDGNLPRLIEQADLKGDLHCHTRETDGSNSLEEMALAARARGYDYMALTDHSRSLTITNGLSLERLEEARRQVAQLNHRLAPFVILLGTEMDILEDGSLDYPDETLASLDYVSASIHSRFKQAEPVMTARILRAISNPLVHTLNHPHGRLLGIRPSYGVDMPRVVTTAATVGCAMEVSADPARMDLDGGWARRVREAGGRCTISSDAHSTLDFDNIWLAIGSARRGWLTTDDVLNTRPLDEFRALLRQRSQRIPR